jgi:hypothetical protein
LGLIVEQQILDWYHIARRFESIGKALVYLPHVEDFEHRLSRHWHHLNRAKWKVWHGNLYGASIALSSFYDGVNIHVMIAEAIPAGRRTGSRAVGRIVVAPSEFIAGANPLDFIGDRHEYPELFLLLWRLSVARNFEERVASPAKSDVESDAK